MSLGGVRDEAEIRGHRRTYIGSMPGKILQNMTKVAVRNPLFLLDEVDKMGQDFRGDPSSALLEVLDPEQNNTFVDHYVEVEYDLSDVMFVATANTMNIPAPLLDRMEVIRLSGYTEDEKIAIAKQYLLPKQIKNNGLKAEELHVAESALRDIVRYYTREAGVRNLERDISKICRKVVKSLLLKQSEGKARKARGPVEVNSKNLDKYLGVRRYTYGIAERRNQVGQVTGLAWTEVGGDLLTIESVALPGKGKTTSTGKLGDVMNESIAAALSVVRHRSRDLGIAPEFYTKTDLHIHLPEGATPKDGPSAGTAIATSMVSTLTGIPVRCDVAMTGEITLRGEVLPIGGLKEKLLAAGRGGIKTVLIPEENVKDLVEIPDDIKNKLDIHPVRWIEQVLERALERQPARIVEEADKAVEPSVPPAPAADDNSAVIKHKEGVGEQIGNDRRDRAPCGHIEGGGRPRAGCDRRRDHVNAAQGRHGDARRLRLVLRGQAQPARGPQSADGRRDPHRGRQGSEVPRWKGAEGCDKLTGFPKARRVCRGLRHGVSGKSGSEMHSPRSLAMHL
jgi:ATP-dependent Lon protease